MLIYFSFMQFNIINNYNEQCQYLEGKVRHYYTLQANSKRLQPMQSISSNRLELFCKIITTSQSSHINSCTTTSTEAVQWIILSHSIVLPDAFFTALRNTPANNYGNKIAFNHHSTQNINGRVVKGSYGVY